MEEKQYWVYALSDPRTCKPKYIGVSCRPYQRYEQHLSNSNNRGVRNWIKELKSLGMLPELVKVQRTTKENAFKDEDNIIICCMLCGNNLFNKMIKNYPVNGERI